MMQNVLYDPKKLIALAAILLVAILSLWILAINDERAIAADSSERLDSEQLTTRRMEAQRDRVAVVMQNYKANLSEINRFRDHFQKGKDERMVRISAFLDERTQARSLRRDRIDYNVGRARESGLESYQIQMPLSGRYRDIRALIGDIEASDLFLVITELTLEDDGAARGAVSVQLSLETYFQEQGQ